MDRQDTQDRQDRTDETSQVRTGSGRGDCVSSVSKQLSLWWAAAVIGPVSTMQRGLCPIMAAYAARPPMCVYRARTATAPTGLSGPCVTVWGTSLAPKVNLAKGLARPWPGRVMM